ncbi:histidinol-phosphate transaminase [uncultured Muribaculum sp.]|uniref:histidinol-phosphate transaminase n=1 Tax=uncultured Muribaculum sp. TaxID=1918613 RepID=UPI0026007118|nr:histidinol-phosphate transaminase [uncultured Muribaculum sp.]
MESSVKRLVRPNILSLQPYTCARNEYSGEARAWLDANENSMIDGLNRYPDPLQVEVKKRLAALRGVGVGNIFLGVGSDECIDIVYRTFCRPGIDNVVAIDPTYGMYSVCAAINDVEYRPVRLRPDFSIDEEALFAAMDENTKVLWICSPNNPTGNAFPVEQLRRIASRFSGITVIDEAYVDFSPLGSMVPEIPALPRLIVMQTFSKAWAAAAMRLGIAYAHPCIIGIFNNVKYPYNINILTQREAIRVLDSADDVLRVADCLVGERERLARSLRALPVVNKVYPSDANFLLVATTDADGLYAYLRDKGVIVRNRTHVTLCAGCLRITVGTPEENTILLDALASFHGE